VTKTWIELRGARRQFRRVDRQPLASVAGAHRRHHHVSHRDRRAQFRQQSIEGRGRIIFGDADDSWSVRALVDKA